MSEDVLSAFSAPLFELLFFVSVRGHAILDGSDFEINSGGGCFVGDDILRVDVDVCARPTHTG